MYSSFLHSRFALCKWHETASDIMIRRDAESKLSQDRTWRNDEHFKVCSDKFQPGIVFEFLEERNDLCGWEWPLIGQRAVVKHSEKNLFFDIIEKHLTICQDWLHDDHVTATLSCDGVLDKYIGWVCAITIHSIGADTPSSSQLAGSQGLKFTSTHSLTSEKSDIICSIQVGWSVWSTAKRWKSVRLHIFSLPQNPVKTIRIQHRLPQLFDGTVDEGDVERQVAVLF